MKLGKLGRLAAAMAVCGCISGMAVGAEAEDYSFETYNSTDNAIRRILVSEDNETWGEFQIGRGIRPGETVTLVWDEGTDNESCKQFVKAVFDDGSESEPAMFNFCEQGLALEF